MGKTSDSSFTDRIRSWAKQIANAKSRIPREDSSGGILPTYTNNSSGGVSEKTDGGRGLPSGSTASAHNGGRRGRSGDGGGDDEESTKSQVADNTSSASPPPAPSPDKSETEGAQPAAVEPDEKKLKPKLTTRMKNGMFRFGKHTKSAICHSWINVLLVFVPVGIIAQAIGLHASVVFALNAIAIIPLAGLLSHATEAVACRLGDTLGALLNVSFGNAVELIIFIIALVKNEIRIVQASLLGSILANLLLILGMAFLLGGLRFREQIYNSTVTQMSACLLSLSVMSLLLPTAFYASFNDPVNANDKVLRVSRGTSVVLLLVYVLYLVFQLKSHAYLYESTPQEVIDEESHPGMLHDMLGGSSSSSDNSSSSSSSDTDTSGSVTTTKRIKRAFRNRRRRKSSASVSSTNTPSNPSILSSPSTTERAGNYWEHQVHPTVSRRPSYMAAIASGDEADGEHEDDRFGMEPRRHDFAASQPEKAETSKLSVRKKSRKQKKKHKKRHHDGDEIAVDDKTRVKKPSEPIETEQSENRVVFVEEIQVVPDQSHVKRGAFNMRGSIPALRPAMPKMFSHNVFVTPPSAPQPAPTPLSAPIRARSYGLRRTSSLPDRLNHQTTPSRSATTPRDPLPPYQHQRAASRIRSEQSTDAEDDGEEEVMSRTAATVLLLVSTGLVAVCAEFLVNAIPEMVQSSPVSQAFIGLIILPIVGNAAEHVTAVTVAAKNKMDLAIGVAVGSSIQIALFVTPLVVLLGWILQKDMSLYFNLFETISLFVTAFVVNFLVLDGRSNYLEGSLLIAAYVIIALAAFYYPDQAAQSVVGGGSAI